MGQHIGIIVIPACGRYRY